jgi:hypothetical protein
MPSNTYKVKVIVADGSDDTISASELQYLIADYLWKKKHVDVHDMFVGVEHILENMR